MGTVIDINSRVQKKASRTRKNECLVQMWARVTPLLKEEIEGLAQLNGLSPSQYLRVLLTVAVEEKWMFRPQVQQQNQTAL